jgi:hypothetical protein
MARGVLFTLIMLSFVGCLQTLSPTEIYGGIGKFPDRAKSGDPINITWWLAYPKGTNITHTGIHYGYFGIPGPLGLDVDPSDPGYPEVIAIPIDRFGEGRNFQATLIPLKKGRLYFRAHAVLDGKNLWSEERSIVVE